MGLEREIPVSTLRELLAYEPETGRLTWLPRKPELFADPCYAGRWNNRYAGKDALTNVSTGGYPRGNIFDRNYRAHRVAWAIHYGEWPTKQIDHINGNRADNRISNLRLASNAENQRNSKLRSDNSSGFKGVSYVKATGKWRAYVNHNGRQHSVGYHACAADAASAAKRAAEALHGEFARR